MLLLDNRLKNKVVEYMPETNVIARLVSFFDLFSDNTRIRILSALLVTKMCVTDLADILNLNQTTVSHQLRLLRQNGLVNATRQGKIIFYSVENKQVGELLLKGVESLGF